MMKLKSKPGSKIQKTQINKNKKKEVDITSTPKPENNMSLIKKNEFALILFGALLLTVIVFFLFFRTSDSQKTVGLKKISNSFSSVDLDERLQVLEKKLDTLTKESAAKNDDKKNPNIDLLAQRVTRLETAFSVKFDSVIERIAGIEKNISQLKDRPVNTVTAPPVQKTVSSVPVKKTSTVPPKTVVKKGVFHTVQKKETLYSISKKYKTTVTALRKLNNLSATATIYPGDNILVK